MFAPEQQFHHYLGYCFAGFTMPNTSGLSHEAVLWSTPGRGAALYAVRDSADLHGFLVFARPEPPYDAFRDPAAQRDLVGAFAAYERDTRGFVELNQAQVGAGGAALFPVTAEALAQRNERLRALTTLPRESGRPGYTALTLPDFPTRPGACGRAPRRSPGTRAG
ncbi:hypothetical protein [Pseudonocardia sp. DLS-67]